MDNHFHTILQRSTWFETKRKPDAPSIYKQACFYIIRCEYLLFWFAHMLSAPITFHLFLF